MLEDDDGICGYALGALDSRHFYDRFDREWRPAAVCAVPRARAATAGTGALPMKSTIKYHHPNYFCPEPHERFPSHLHIDLLPACAGPRLRPSHDGAQSRDVATLGSPGAHLGVSLRNPRAVSFYRHLGFRELTTEGCIYLGLELG